MTTDFSEASCCSSLLSAISRQALCVIQGLVSCIKAHAAWSGLYMQPVYIQSFKDMCTHS